MPTLLPPPPIFREQGAMSPLGLFFTLLIADAALALVFWWLMRPQARSNRSFT
ncbi:MAG: hypothetical protein ACT4PZ_00250 [Panacagrimonas sp.]